MRWPPYQHVFFDCDSTLSAIEGIDVLAESTGKQAEIEALTNAAMDGQLDLEDIYAKRLQTILPTQQQVQMIRHAYKQHIVQDAAELLQALAFLGHTVYIISGGLAEPVEEFGIYLGVPRERIRAVKLDYNALAGKWWSVSHDNQAQYMDYGAGSLTVSDGKAEVVKELLGAANGRSLLIGDGTSDLLASRAVDLFVGFGGVVARDRVRTDSPIFINTPSIAPLLLLAAGPNVLSRLKSTSFAKLAKKSSDLIESGALTFNHEQLREKFNKAHAASR